MSRPNWRALSLHGRFLAFEYGSRPNGGMNDCVGGFDTVEWAEAAIGRLDPAPVNAHVLDTETRQILGVTTMMKTDDSPPPTDCG